MRIFAAMLWLWAGTSTATPADSISLDAEQNGGHFAIIAQASKLFGEQGPTAIMIDIKPGSADNVVSAGAKLVIPVAIFGSSDLDVIGINPRTIRLNGVDIMLVGKSDKNLCKMADINDDSYEDLVCDVRTTGYRVAEGEYTIIIKAGTYNGQSLRGEDRITIVVN
ncbi:MAG: hypothetical protein KJP11_00395 [Gammaproteobacteria bacterium]|nr:hypothetical protein [Gammaproteobacteria bacterium]